MGVDLYRVVFALLNVQARYDDINKDIRRERGAYSTKTKIKI